MTTRRRQAPLARRVLPLVVVAVGGAALWRSLDTSAANSLRLTLRRPQRPTSRGKQASNATAPIAPSRGGDQTGSTHVATTTSTVCAHPQRVDGPVIDTRWGPVQVRAQLGTAGHICSADAIQVPSDHNQSVFINQQAVPWIDTEVKTQGMNFDAIGGATITSDGYRASLQAILDSRGQTRPPAT